MQGLYHVPLAGGLDLYHVSLTGAQDLCQVSLAAVEELYHVSLADVQDLYHVSLAGGRTTALFIRGQNCTICLRLVCCKNHSLYTLYSVYSVYRLHIYCIGAKTIPTCQLLTMGLQCTIYSIYQD